MAVPRELVRPAERRPGTTRAERCSVHVGSEPLLLRWAQSFLFAGSSALLLLIARIFPHYWYFSLFALTPFLYRIITSKPGESLRLGLLLGISFFGASSGHSLVSAPLSHFAGSLAGISLFSLFGWAIGWARKRWGFSPFIVAVLWVGLEMGLLRFGFAGGILAEPGLSSPFFHGLIGLLGCVAASALIVALNSLLILTVVKALEMVGGRRRVVEEEQTWSTFRAQAPRVQRISLASESRAPPYVDLAQHFVVVE